ncbi:hypothetical protein NLJ89_g10928 [Agrocybe chaxingu]|uniref:Uncharacterized protein n=1 Tax=Agrocybe chaxingu TaxID=84603 RepID=A0A9W8JXQ7_9AGAR|nr:hypothetical protein NLJ89_g10928 [Agrocybe chaxingu]
MFKALRRINVTPAPWPLPITLNLLRKVWGSWVKPIVGEERTPTFLSSKNAATVKEESELPSAPDQDISSATSSPNPSRFLSPDASSVHDSIGKAKPEATSSEDLNPTRPKPYLTSTWVIRRDAILGGLPCLSGGYLVLMSLGMCVVVLRVLTRRADGLLGRR